VPFTLPVKVLPSDVSEFELIIAVVLAKPFTVEVSRLPVEDREFEVADWIAFESDVVARTPFTVELSTTPEVLRILELMIEVLEATPFTEVLIVLALLETPLLEMIDEVAMMPLVFKVRVLPATLADSELIKLVKPLVIPLTNVWNELVVVAKTLLLTIVEVAATPLVLLVKIFPTELSVLL
jgi:hypothetical protein